MQAYHAIEPDPPLAGWGIRSLLLAPLGSRDGQTVGTRISSLGGRFEQEVELFAALAAVIDDPTGYGLFVMACDSYGGLEAGKKACNALVAAQAHVPAILIARDCGVQSFPEGRDAPIILRAPLSDISLRVAIEHALRERLWRAA